ncbi:amidophosphoribosyltransferase [Orenia metallireducens]|jgi:amidophosphoribosyltransferase|uniref:Amidophosphoribosyltransferase n=1 Tax=Orenia metallireducens TaxID=1413210 RepID=A0A285G4P7_9FIRM|nr:amidophosphoribosyltransferase [Orenia metallireducens]PRX31807.1 amidophosphoribosyltransferase [Orenia metallireducens]SNY17401.1 amidophosphoribosyltransferase [Orenia metallireducens]
MEKEYPLQKKMAVDKMEEECGVFGIYDSKGSNDVATLSYLGLHALQHRGQESAGICVNHRGKFNIYKGMGLVNNVFNEDILADLKGEIAIGHVRYSTTGSSLLANAQPLLTNSIKGDLAIAHNGNLINSSEIRLNLENQGSIFHSTLDTEVIAHLVARSFKDNIVEALMHSLQQVKGAYSLIAMAGDNLIAARDPHGFRPLSLGKLGDAYVVASETCAFDIIGAKLIRDIKPGEMIVINKDGITSRFYSEEQPSRFCIFEFIYFARPDSVIGGQNVHLARKEMGRQLAREMDVEADIVVPVPSSGISAAIGFAEESGIPYEKGILRNRYVGRTFIQPTQEIRDLKVRVKLNPIREIVEGKRVILIDDSIVRGTTSKQIIRMMREAGASEIHFAISSPPVIESCYYGLDTSRRQELIAAHNSVEEIANYIGADSLTYVSIEGLLNSIKAEGFDYCTACFTGDYPIGRGTDKYALEE